MTGQYNKTNLITVNDEQKYEKEPFLRVNGSGRAIHLVQSGRHRRFPDCGQQPSTHEHRNACRFCKNTCILEVWTKDGSTRRVRQEQLVTAGAANITFSFELADQGDYKAVLWADYIVSGATASGDHYPDKYYKTDNADGLKKVTIITAAYTYADQLREAFAAVVPFTKGATAKNDLTATLVRPITKVTIAEKNTEMIGKCKDMTAKI